MAETLFKKYKRKFIKHFGRHPLNNVEIDKFGKEFFGSRYKGSFAQNEKFELKPGLYIINTDTKSGAGIHWVGLYLTSKTAYIYDSFARDSKKLLPHLLKHLKHKKIVESDRSDKEQRDLEVICGHLSLAWLAVVRDLGINKAKKI